MKRNEFIATLRSIHHLSDPNSSIECYREMGKVCKLADYFDADNKFYKLNRKTLQWEFLPKPPFSGINNGFVAVNVEVPSTNNKRSPIIPFFSIAINKKGNDSDELRQQVLTIAQNSAEEGFLTGSQFVNNDHIERIIFEITIKNGKIERMLIPAGTPPTFYNEKHRDIDAILKDLWENHENSFVQSWCEPFFGIENGITLYCNIRAVDWDSDEVKSHSIFVCMFESEDIITDWVSAYGDDAMNIIAMLKSVFISDIHKKQMMEAEKSAKAAIMSRNMSHNLGSHVMAYLKQHLNSVQDMIRDNILSQMIMPDEIMMNDLGVWKDRIECTIQQNLKDIKEQKLKNGNSDIDIESAEQVKEIALPFLVGLGKFISYLQERQDFIATIATAYAPYFSQVNFKDFIYDELNPDLRYERHSDRIGMKPDNILLGNIARSEGLARVTQPTKSKKEGMSDIIIQFRSFDGHIPSSEQQKNDLDAIREINISLPGGVVGRQAIFSIVENVIRNAAKHGTWGNNSNDASLKLTLNIYDKADILQGTITDNDAADDKHLGLLSFLKKYYLYTTDIDDLYICTITDNMQFESNHGDKWEKLSSLNKALIEPYIDKQGLMVNANKGIKEMRISASWIRGLNEYEVKVPINPDGSYSEVEYWKENHAPIILARPSKNIQNGTSNLQYIICLQKPKAVAIISKNLNSSITLHDGKTIDMILNANSCKVYTKEEFLKLPNKSFDFIIFNDSADIQGYDSKDYIEIRKLSNNRILKASDGLVDLTLLKTILTGNEKASKYEESFKKLLKSLYQQLSHYQIGEAIYIDDEKTDAKYNVEMREEYPKDLIHVSKDYKHVYPYMYRTHHETESIFSKFMSGSNIEELKKNIFVEGITGNNSTDRLVRNDTLDELWFYKHLRAMKSKIAIIDERIFSKVYRREEKELRQEIFDNLTKEHIKKLLLGAASSNKTKFQIKDFRTIKEKPQLLEYIKEQDILLTDADFAGIQYDMKGVNIFTIIKRYDSNNQPDGLDIYGYYGLLAPSLISETNTYRSIIGRIGHICMDINRNIIITLYNDKYDHYFDYISIHQGILDKVYEHMGIKQDSEAKHKVTLKIYKTLINKPEDFIIDDYDDEEENLTLKKRGYFLPKLMIHSGRSKPSFIDMPQKQPFIQYSAVENAVLDCKFSLVELLDYARYEKE